MRVTVVFGEQADILGLAAEGELWAEDNEVNRAQIESIWAVGGSATLFSAKDLYAVLEDAELHHPTWSELRVIRV